MKWFTTASLGTVGNWWLIASLVVLGATAQAALNDTGIKTCSNATQNGLPCPVAGFPGQDAEFGTNAFNFTKLDAAGNAMSVTATNHTCVQDNTTGLMWEVKTDDGGLHDKGWTYSLDRTGDFAAEVNATNLCGHNDWRVPDPHELASIVNYGVYSTSIDDEYFPYINGHSHWTNSSVAFDSSYWWIVDFGDGGVYDGYRYIDYAVWVVRSGQWTFSFLNNNDGTISDQNTGLMWAKCSQGQNAAHCSGSATVMAWQQALQAADSSTLAGYSDWRLPNVKELQSLANYTVYNPAISTSYFPNTDVSHYYWTSSPVAFVSSNSWTVNFNYGDVSNGNRSGNYAVRLVRGEPVTFSFLVLKTGTGSVTSNPVGINCGTVCSANFAKDTAVTLTATPSSGSTFGGWNGACSGTGTCSVTMNAAKSATATFNLIPTAPTAVTNAPSVITATSARLSGTVNPNEAVTNVTFDFGATTAYGTNIIATPASIAATAGATAVSADKTGLTCSTTYHYRVKATNSKGTTLGADKAFTTSLCPRDLVITSLGITPYFSAVGQTLTVRVTVQNQGTMAAAGGTLSLWLNKTAVANCNAASDKTVNIGTLAAGASKAFVITGLSSATAGNKTLRAFTDSTCATTETNESNNQKTKNYAVGMPDLTVISITLTPTNPIAGSTFTAKVVVKNQGPVALGYTSFVDLWLNQPANQSCGAAGDVWEEISALAAGASQTFTFSGLTAGTAGTKTLRAYADSWCERTDANRNNNQMTKAYTVANTPNPMCIGQPLSGVACIMVYMPVCGCDGHTYGNECEMHAAGIAWGYPGECTSSL